MVANAKGSEYCRVSLFLTFYFIFFPPTKSFCNKQNVYYNSKMWGAACERDTVDALHITRGGSPLASATLAFPTLLSMKVCHCANTLFGLIITRGGD